MISIEIHDLDKEKPPAVGEMGYTKNLAPPFDFERLTRFMSYGFFMAPVQFLWFGFLSRTFPLTKKNPSIPALKRVAVDQLMFAPFGMHSLELPVDGCSADYYRFGVLLHLHDRCRGWWPTGTVSQVPGCVSAHSQGQLRALAGGSDPELPSGSHSVPDCRSIRCAGWYKLTVIAAVCVVGWYRVDRIPLADQLR